MAEEVLSEQERNRVLAQVANPVKKDGVSETKEVPTDLSKATFGQLLEMSMKNRETVEEVKTQADEGIREAVIEKSRLDLIGKLLERK